MAAIRSRDCGVLHSVVTPVPSSEPVVEIQASIRRRACRLRLLLVEGPVMTSHR
jgi:hypothetical protein